MYGIVNCLNLSTERLSRKAVELILKFAEPMKNQDQFQYFCNPCCRRMRREEIRLQVEEVIL